MKKQFIISILFVFFGLISFAQTIIPYGISADSANIDEIHSPGNSSLQRFYYYKPSSYNPISSPLLIAIHGNGSNGLSPINDLIDIAERRKALIVSLDFNSGSLRLQEPIYYTPDTISFCNNIGPGSKILKEIYHHILLRENRTDISSYLIGFSAGGQFVTRYMLLRQAYPDSIPLKMAVSCSPYGYTFPTPYFNGDTMYYMCGSYLDSLFSFIQVSDCNTMNFYNFFCKEEITQYYNENYAVLIGTADTQSLIGDGACFMAQGSNRYERARTFYHFCDSNAINIGTTLKWQYDSIIGVGHNQNLMYNSKRNITDTSSIAESLLFDTPYHNVPFIAPRASFFVDSTIVTLPNATVHFTNTSSNATSFLWDFGDSTYSTDINPIHTYTHQPVYAFDTIYPYDNSNSFTVQLTAFNDSGCSNWTIKRYYILVNNSLVINNSESFNNAIKCYPNPSKDITMCDFSIPEDDEVNLSIYNFMGQKVADLFNNYAISGETYSVSFASKNLSDGVYVVVLKTSNRLESRKLFIIK